MNVLAGAPKFGYDNKSGKVLPEPPETDAQKAVAEQVEAVRDYATKATNAIVENETLKKSMMEDIRSEFPVPELFARSRHNAKRRKVAGLKVNPSKCCSQ